ncbi:biofilm regulation phosphoprotein SiaC [Parachitinimonas caeni]|uniref:Biofilm regulation phosphoprotein SiaC n=1 Tax=Parachitinimonas caeni TaxID=3031301 RepID=A0ABT7E576_9NEIS|nr:biofilm regulation phosphoprotein SiaC [Parachitinimonas caeni]MDK2126072.1 biofilm regulation phosphoprotein SiaC [Parachitinimonas caeni]
MNDLSIAATQSSPAVNSNWQHGLLSMCGDSYPENSFELFDPVINWVERYLDESDAPLRLELHLLYLNTSSIKAVMDIFDLMEEAHRRSRPVSVCWYYDEDNPRAAELAAEFKEDCSFPFDILSKTS